MRELVFALLLVIPQTLANTCSQFATCADCDTYLENGEQICSWCVHSAKCVSPDGLDCLFGTHITKSADCPVEVKKGFEYEEDLVRNEMLAISGAAYSSDPQQCLTRAVHDAKLVRQINVRCDSAKDDVCSGFAAISDYHKAVILSFRGTEGNMQLFLEGIETIFQPKSSLANGGKVSKYFFDGFMSVWSSGLMEDAIRAIAANPTYDLWVTGHSLGGSMASIAAYTVAQMSLLPSDRIKLVTYGQPRTGDHDFAAAHDSMLPYTYRVTHKTDIVPHLPSRDFEGYHHHRYEVWYDNDMKEGSSYKMCLTPDDDSCSDKDVDLSIDNHLYYFGKEVADYGRGGCV